MTMELDGARVAVMVADEGPDDLPAFCDAILHTVSRRPVRA